MFLTVFLQNGNVYVKNLNEVVVKSANDIFTQMKKGEGRYNDTGMIHGVCLVVYIVGILLFTQSQNLLKKCEK